MDRYIKHINFDKIGVDGQKKFLNSSILIVGAGALGTNFINILSRAGIGNITIIDNDKVELSNLQRQTIYTEDDIEKFKVKSLKKHINKINSDIKVAFLKERLDEINVNICKKYDLIVDATDNFKTRFLINDFCFENNIPWIFTGVLNKEAQTILLDNLSLEKIINKNSNYKKLENMPSEAILSTSVSAITSFASTLILRHLAGDKSLNNILYSLDAWNLNLKRMQF
jgi:molybdopterin-synthase adenylyltransferase